MRAEVRELWRFRELLWAMVERELRIRYKNSVLGFAWSLVNPLVTVLVMTLVFKTFLRNDSDNFSAYILAAYLPYLFFQLAVMDSAQSVIAALPMIKKVYFPREILPLAGVIANFIHFLLSIGVFIGFLLVVWAVSGFQVFPLTYRLAFLPVLMLIHLALTTGVAFLISAYNVFFEDVKYVVGVMLYLLFFLTPIMYFSETVFHALEDKPGGHLMYVLYHLNPIAMFSTAYRKTLVAPGAIDVGAGEKVLPLPFDWGLFGVAVALSLLALVGGYALFNRVKWRFVERP